MSKYTAIAAMAASISLRDRVAACAAQENKESPVMWASERMWKICATPGWEDAWQSAVDGYSVNQNPDTGARTDVISDQMILAVVQAMG